MSINVCNSNKAKEVNVWKWQNQEDGIFSSVEIDTNRFQWTYVGSVGMRLISPTWSLSERRAEGLGLEPVTGTTCPLRRVGDVTADIVFNSSSSSDSSLSSSPSSKRLNGVTGEIYSKITSVQRCHPSGHCANYFDVVGHFQTDQFSPINFSTFWWFGQNPVFSF